MKKFFILLYGLTTAAAFLSCATSSTTTEPDDPFELTVPAVDLGRVSEFLPFGYNFGGGKLSPAYEFRASPQSLPVYASTSGVVEAAEYQSRQRDWEIRIRHQEHAEYLLIYDHISSPTVSVGEAVEPGQILGTLGEWTGSAGRVEFQVNVAQPGGGDKHLCPSLVGSPAFNAAHDAAFARAGRGGASACLLEEFTPQSTKGRSIATASPDGDRR